jgi:hypothetical protein
MICVICIYTRAEAGEVAAIINGQGVCNEHVAAAKQNDTLMHMIEFTRVFDNPSYSGPIPPSLRNALETVHSSKPAPALRVSKESPP